MTNSKKMNPQKLKDTLLKYALYIILLLLLVVIVAIKPNFLSVGNLISILKQASTKGNVINLSPSFQSVKKRA